MSDRIPLITASSLGGLARIVEAQLGKLALNRALGDAGLRPDTPLREGYFVPEVAIVTFLGSVARQTGDPLLGVRLGVRRNIGTQPALWGQYVTEAPTLGDCLARLERALVCFSNYPGILLDASNERAWLRYHFLTSGHRDYAQIAVGFIASVINIFRYYTGPDWFPEIIEVDAPQPSSPSALEEILPTEIHYNAECIGLAFSREFLTLRRQAELPLGHTTFSDALRARLHRPAQSFEAVVEGIIRLQIETGNVSLDAVARSLDLGVRTVQRKLEPTGLHFRDLAGRVRMDLARERIAETSLPLAKVAESLGYTNPFNFSRAFKRAVGVSPSQFRTLSIRH